MVRDIFSYDIKMDRRQKSPTYVVYALGVWDDHLMDWRGCNYRRIKIPGQPVFNSLWKASQFGLKWIRNPKNRSIEGVGQHAGDGRDRDYGIINQNLYSDEAKANETDEYIKQNWETIRKDGIADNWRF